MFVGAICGKFVHCRLRVVAVVAKVARHLPWCRAEEAHLPVAGGSSFFFGFICTWFFCSSVVGFRLRGVLEQRCEMRFPNRTICHQKPSMAT
jgi:hypothetical protein